MTPGVMRLHEVSDELAAIADVLLENGGELTDELAAQLTALEGAFEQKVERILLHARNLHAQADAAKVEADRLAALVGSRRNAAERLEGYVFNEMQRANRDRVETTLIKARLHLNSRPSIKWTKDPAEIPALYRMTVFTLNSVRAYAEWKAGGVLPVGFLVERGKHLRIS